MNANYVGYLLKALEEDERLAVERGLAAAPSARRELELLRQALEPLEADAAPPEPPADLWERTLARIEREVPPPPTARRLRPASSGASRAWWRRSDVLVAASILFVVLSLVPSGLNSLRGYRDRIRCQDNLRVFHQAIST
jgi:anti-sigma-K factor RskA